MAVKKNFNRNWSKPIEGGMDKALFEMATDVHAKAVAIAPHLTGVLVNNGVIAKVNGGIKVTFGGSKAPYARRRHYENKKNPQTLRYLERAGEAVGRSDKGKYFRNKGI